MKLLRRYAIAEIGRRETTKKEMIHSNTIRSVGRIRESYIDKRQFIHCFLQRGCANERASNVNAVRTRVEMVRECRRECNGVEMREMRHPKIGLISFFRSLNYYQWLNETSTRNVVYYHHWARWASECVLLPLPCTRVRFQRFELI